MDQHFCLRLECSICNDGNIKFILKSIRKYTDENSYFEDYEI